MLPPPAIAPQTAVLVRYLPNTTAFHLLWTAFGPPAVGVICPHALTVRTKGDLDVRGRNCDRAVERSPALEGLDELRPLLRRHAAEVKFQAHAVEHAQVGAHRPAAVLHGLDRGAHGLHGDVLIFRDHLHQLDGAGRHPG